MLPHANNGNKKVVLAILASLLVALTALWYVGKTSEQAKAQNSTLEMRTLLEQLKERTQNEPGFVIVFRFANPLIADELWWDVPYVEGERHRSLGEIGYDFVCFYDGGGSSVGTQCTPFSNIVVVSYLNP
jgi:hypothetical protein